MKEKLKSFWGKLKNALEKYIIQFTCAAVIVIIIMFVCIACQIIDNASGELSQTESSSTSADDQDETTQPVVEWGIGITEGITAFSRENDSLDSDGENYMSAYYSNVSLEQVNAYCADLEAQLGIDFPDNERFPKTASWNGKIITLHYNVTEMKFSVTVTLTK